MWRLSPSSRPTRGRASVCASAFCSPRAPRPSAPHGWGAGGSGGAGSGQVFKPGLAPPGVPAGVSGAGLHRCRFVAGRLRGRACPRCSCLGVLLALRCGRREPCGRVGAGSRVCVLRLFLYRVGEMRRGTSNDRLRRFHPHSRKTLITNTPSKPRVCGFAFSSASKCLTRVFVST